MKTPRRKTGVPKTEAGFSPAPPDDQRKPVTTPDERRMLIAHSAYLKAERQAFQSSPEQVTHLVAQRLTDRSHDLAGLADDALGRKPAVPAGPALIEPLNDDRREHPDNPAQKIRHPRNVRILPPSRDFH